MCPYITYEAKAIFGTIPITGKTTESVQLCEEA